MTRVGIWGPIHRHVTADGGNRGVARRVGAALAGVAVAGLALVGLPGRADAHAELLSTEPSPGEQLADAPGAVVLHFSEAVDIADDTVEVLDASGGRLATGAPQHPAGERASVSVALPRLDDGAYVVAWRVVSSDSHPIGGAFTFRVGDAATAEPGDDQALIDDVLGGSRDGDAVLGGVFGIVRFLGFAGVTGLVGAVAFVVWLWPAGAGERRAQRVVAGAWLTAVVATVLCIPLQGAYAIGGTLGDAVDTRVIADELGTRTGRSWLVRLIVLAAGAVLAPRLRRLGEATQRTLAAAAAVALLATVSLTGHAVSGDLVPLAFVVDVVHLAGVSVWLGGLTVLVLALLTGAPAVAEPVVDRFSQVAFGAVVAIVATGTFQGWRQVGGYDALLDTTYGRLLLVKVALFAGTLVAAALSRSWVRRRAVARSAALALSPGPGAVAASPGGDTRLAVLRRSVAAEVALAVAVLAATALLVNAVPGESAEVSGRGGGPFATELTGDDLVLGVRLDRAAVGPVVVTLTVADASRVPVAPEEVRAELSLPARDLGPITVALVDHGLGHLVSDGAEIPFSGAWELDVVVRTSDIDQSTFTTVVEVP
jgi:copper transport protein